MSKRLLIILLICTICWPNLARGQAEKRVPLEISVKVKDKIGDIFVSELKKWIDRSSKFVLKPSDKPRIVLRVDSQPTDSPYQSVICVIWTAMVPEKGASREIFLDYLLMVGVSAAHAGKDAEDVSNLTGSQILRSFKETKYEKN